MHVVIFQIEVILIGIKEKKNLKVVEKYRNESNWDCIVPVSGGKDSTFQVIKMLQLTLDHFV